MRSSAWELIPGIRLVVSKGFMKAAIRGALMRLRIETDQLYLGCCRDELAQVFSLREQAKAFLDQLKPASAISQSRTPHRLWSQIQMLLEQRPNIAEDSYHPQC